MEEVAPIVVLVAILACWVGAQVIWTILYLRRYTRAGYRTSGAPVTVQPDHRFDPERAVTFRGGILTGHGRAVPPSAKLVLDERWAKVSAWALGPNVWIERAKVTEVDRVGRGILFRTADGTYDGLVFLSHANAALFLALVERGWPLPPPDPTPDTRGERT